MWALALQALLSDVDDQVLKEGLLGVGLGAAVVGLGLALLFGAGRSK